MKGQRAILDGEIVVLDEKGCSNFFDLMARLGEPRDYGFDLVWLNGRDLRLSQPLLDRKRRLRRLIPPNDSHLLYVEHLEGDGARFFELVCEQDLEAVICKPGTSHYPFSWIKVKNPNYSQAAAGNGLIVCYRNDSATVISILLRMVCSPLADLASAWRRIAGLFA